MGMNPPPKHSRPNPPSSPPPPKFKGVRLVVQPKEEDSATNQLVGLYLLGKLFGL